MKKALVILLAVCMLFAFSTAAFAAEFNDMADTSDVVKNAVNKMTALEALNGYPDGSFKPTGTITRAEFAKIACVTAGLKTSGEVLVNTPSKFKDVKTGEWYTGWVNLANAKGFIRGYEDGTFRPNQTISNQEVITVLMRLLGYNDNLPGYWPIDYTNQAAKLDILDDVNFVGTAAATRGDVAIMSSNVLDEEMVQYSKDVEDFIFKTRTINGVEYNYTLLYDSFKGGVYEYDGRYTKYSMDSVEVRDFDKKTYTGTEGVCYELGDTQFSIGFNMFGLGSHQGTVIVTTDSKGVKHAKFVEVTSKSVKFTSAKGLGSNKVKLGDKEYTVADYVSAADKTAIQNVANTAADDMNTFFTAYIDEDGRVYKLSADTAKDHNNKRDNRFVKSIDGERVTFAPNDSREELKATKYLFVKDDKYITLADVKPGDVLSQKLDEVFVVTTPKTGKLERYVSGSNNTTANVTIDGITYKSAGLTLIDGDFNKLSPIQDYLGKEVKFVLQSNNKIQTMMTADAVSPANYGVVTDFPGSSGAYQNGLTEVTIFNGEGKTNVYKVQSGKVTGQPNQGENYVDDKEVRVGSLVEFKLDENGVIKSLTRITDNNGGDYVDADDKPVETDKDTKRLNIDGTRYTVADKAVIFNIKGKDDRVIAELVTPEQLTKSSDFEATTIEYASKGRANTVPANTTIKKDGNIANVVAVTNFNGTTGNKYGFIENYGENVVDIDKNRAMKFYGDDNWYELVDGTSAVDRLVQYTLSGNQVKITKGNILTNTAPHTHVVDSFNNGILNVATNGNDIDNMSGQAPNTTYDKKQVIVTEDTPIYVIDENDKVTKGNNGDIYQGAKICVARVGGNAASNPTNNDKYDAAYVVVVKDNSTIAPPPSVITGKLPGGVYVGQTNLSGISVNGDYAVLGNTVVVRVNGANETIAADNDYAKVIIASQTEQFLLNADGKFTLIDGNQATVDFKDISTAYFADGVSLTGNKDFIMPSAFTDKVNVDGSGTLQFATGVDKDHESKLTAGTWKRNGAKNYTSFSNSFSAIALVTGDLTITIDDVTFTGANNSTIVKTDANKFTLGVAAFTSVANTSGNKVEITTGQNLGNVTGNVVVKATGGATATMAGAEWSLIANNEITFDGAKGFVLAGNDSFAVDIAATTDLTINAAKLASTKNVEITGTAATSACTVVIDKAIKTAVNDQTISGAAIDTATPATDVSTFTIAKGGSAAAAYTTSVGSANVSILVNTETVTIACP